MRDQWSHYRPLVFRPPWSAMSSVGTRVPRVRWTAIREVVASGSGVSWWRRSSFRLDRCLGQRMCASRRGEVKARGDVVLAAQRLMQCLMMQHKTSGQGDEAVPKLSMLRALIGLRQHQAGGKDSLHFHVQTQSTKSPSDLTWREALAIHTTACTVDRHGVVYVSLEYDSEVYPRRYSDSPPAVSL